jgi:hypothetical protein
LFLLLYSCQSSNLTQKAYTTTIPSLAVADSTIKPRYALAIGNQLLSLQGAFALSRRQGIFADLNAGNGIYGADLGFVLFKGSTKKLTMDIGKSKRYRDYRLGIGYYAYDREITKKTGGEEGERLLQFVDGSYLRLFGQYNYWISLGKFRFAFHTRVAAIRYNEFHFEQMLMNFRDYSERRDWYKFDGSNKWTIAIEPAGTFSYTQRTWRNQFNIHLGFVYVAPFGESRYLASSKVWETNAMENSTTSKAFPLYRKINFGVSLMRRF